MALTVNALIPKALIAFFSPWSKSRSPMYTISSGFTHGLIQPKLGSEFMFFARPKRNPRGIPCMFPEPVVSGVLMSACASTYGKNQGELSLSIVETTLTTYPNNGIVGTLLFDARNGANRNTVISTKNQGEGVRLTSCWHIFFDDSRRLSNLRAIFSIWQSRVALLLGLIERQRR